MDEQGRLKARPRKLPATYYCCGGVALWPLPVLEVDDEPVSVPPVPLWPFLL